MHHYYRTAQVPFVKTPWVRSMDLAVFTHFQAAAVRMFGNVPLGKGDDDDGATFEAVIKESRFPHGAEDGQAGDAAGDPRAIQGV